MVFCMIDEILKLVFKSTFLKARVVRVEEDTL